MKTLVTRIHPDLPLCWEDADTLRVGFERADARVVGPSAGVQRLIGALRTGIRQDHFAQEVRRTGATPKEARELLATLRTVLVTVAEAGPRSRAAGLLKTLLCDDGRPVTGFREALLSSGICTFDSDVSVEQTELVILVERFLEPLERAQRWLVEATPHLLVRFTDRAVTVGPLIRRNGIPCHTCVTLTMLAEDAAYPTLAAQLYGKTPRSETAATAHMAAAFAAMFMRNWLTDRAEVHTTRVRLPATRGLVSGPPEFETVQSHAECACGAASR